MFCMLEKEKIYHREKQVILLMIPKEGKSQARLKGIQDRYNGWRRWHYLAVKRLSALLRGITLKHFSDFYCLNSLYSFKTKNKLALYEKLSENKDFCNVILLSQDGKILVFNQYQKSDKVRFIIYADLEYRIEKFGGCENNPEKSSTTKVRKINNF